jgi:hypothetical protein
VYHHENGEGTHIDADAASLHKTETQRRDADSSSSEDDDVDETEETVADEDGDQAAHRDEITYEEIRGGLPYEHDLEAPPPLEKKKSSRSIKDPNLVTWDSDDDPKNPKNCKF